MDWILASQSPRRKQLLGELLTNFEIIPAVGEENCTNAKTPAELVEKLAMQKAREVALRKEAEHKAVIGSDTIVTLDNEVMGKPKDEADARRMLTALSGRTHEVYTGVCISVPTKTGRKELVESACTKVEFYPLSKAQIEEYIATGSPMDKAGAYGIQDGGLVKSIDGSFSCVVGLPQELCKKMLKQATMYALK
jgi:septum formation protein